MGVPRDRGLTYENMPSTMAGVDRRNEFLYLSTKSIVLTLKKRDRLNPLRIRFVSFLFVSYYISATFEKHPKLLFYDCEKPIIVCRMEMLAQREKEDSHEWLIEI